MRLISTLPQLPPNNELWPRLWRCFSATLLEWTIFLHTKKLPWPKPSVYLCFHLPSPQGLPQSPSPQLNSKKAIWWYFHTTWEECLPLTHCQLTRKKMRKNSKSFSYGSSQPFFYHYLQWKTSQTSGSKIQAILSSLGIPFCIIKHAFMLAFFSGNISAKYFGVHRFLWGSRCSLNAAAEQILLHICL